MTRRHLLNVTLGALAAARLPNNLEATPVTLSAFAKQSLRKADHLTLCSSNPFSLARGSYFVRTSGGFISTQASPDCIAHHRTTGYPDFNSLIQHERFVTNVKQLMWSLAIIESGSLFFTPHECIAYVLQIHTEPIPLALFDGLNLRA